MSVKAKVSKAKRNNQKKNKLIKQGVIKKGLKKIRKPQVHNKVAKKAPQQCDASEEESDHGEDMLQMVEEEDLDFLKQAITNRSYGILNKVKYSGRQQAISLAKPKKKKHDNDETLENEYENQIEDTSVKRIRALLPVKTQKGLVHQEIVEEIVEDSEPIKKGTVFETPQNVDEEEEDSEEGDFSLHETDIDLSKPISVTQLLATRNETLRQKKIHIGTLSSGLLENPEEKVTNLRTLLNLMDDETPEVFFTVRKLVIMSLLEVFKDILPDFEIKSINLDGVKLKKDTLKLQKYEENLLLYYKKFLQKLEKYCFWLVKKKGDSRKISEEEVKLSELSIQAMAELLSAHPYFNYAQNIAQVVVPFLNNPRKNVRDLVKGFVCNVFREDKKEEITLKILRLINSYLKTHAQNVNPEMLEVLLVLNLKDVNLDAEKEQDVKNKKLQAKKGRLLQLSKRERKRKKKLQELEKEMLETRAEESRIVKQQNQTEIMKIIFNIYFRILKNSENRKMLSVCLEGLTKFAHCINLEYYVDIVNVLSHLLKQDWLGYREQLHCIQTIFIMLSGQGEAINIDPTRFYVNLYRDLLTTHSGKTHKNSIIVLKTLIDALIKRRKKITNKRTINFVKKLATFSLQLLHNGSLGCLGLIKTLMQLNRSIDILLDLDSSGGEGKFQPEIEDPEYANASNSALFETVLLSRHYHPVVRKISRNIASGVPATGDGSLPLEYGKLTVEQLYADFDMSQMAFNPPVPVLKSTNPKARSKKRNFADLAFEKECRDFLKVMKSPGPFWISLKIN
ncbi:nucleolar complex protein 3 [Euwallacea similis]|uniref:nucleolar complex protein 3 n=1 Tax=Euwallacea similis TaxID=1736056 RepID=UPI00344D4A98